jgi:tellurite resistance protein
MQDKTSDSQSISSLDNADTIDASNIQAQEINSHDNTDAKDGSTGYKEQAFNEALIKLMVLLYQIDGKVTLGEQDYFDEVIEAMQWRSGVAISAFVNDAIHQTRVAIDTANTREYLFGLSTGLNINAAHALEVAMDISEADGNRSDDELELLSLLSNRVLATGVV